MGALLEVLLHLLDYAGRCRRAMRDSVTDRSVTLDKTDTSLNDCRTIGDARTAGVGRGGYDVLSIRFYRRLAVRLQIRRVVFHGYVESRVSGPLLLVPKFEVTCFRPIKYLDTVLYVRVVRRRGPIGLLLTTQGSSQKKHGHNDCIDFPHHVCRSSEKVYPSKPHLASS